MNEKNDNYDDNDNDDVSDDNDNCDDENEYGRSPSNGLSSGLNQKLRCCVNTLSVDYMRNIRKRRLLEHTLDVSMNCNSFSALSDDSVMMMMMMIAKIMEVRMIRSMMMVMMMIIHKDINILSSQHTLIFHTHGAD